MSPLFGGARVETYKPIVEDYELEEAIATLSDSSVKNNRQKSDIGRMKSDSNLLHPDTFRRRSTSTISETSLDERIGRASSYTANRRYASRSPASPRTWRASFEAFYQVNRGLVLVALAQFFGALMNVMTRLLELEGEGMHPFQIVFVRAGITAVLSSFYMWWVQTPDFPFGPKGVRKLLVLRGFSGFFGIFGMYYSLQYLPLADATVITFLAPATAGYFCYLFYKEPFSRTEQIGSLVSLLGVVLIARPTSFFDFTPGHVSEPFSTPSNVTASGAEIIPPPSNGFDVQPTAAQRLSAVLVALLGVLGAAGAYTTMRWIGRAAHPLISVNYYSVWCTIVATAALSIGPFLPQPLYSSDLHFALPNGIRQWTMLLSLGVCGLVMQFMLAAGLAHEKSQRATNMVYTNMLFALLFDRWIFGTVPGVWSLIGSSLILGSAIVVAIGKGQLRDVPTRGDNPIIEHVSDEEVGMLADPDVHGEEHREESEERGRDTIHRSN